MTHIFNHRLFIMLLFAFFIQRDIVAQNLLLNPSFEDTLPCPQSAPLESFLRPEHWFKPTAGSSDFFNTVTNCAWGGGVPQNVFGWQNPRTGDSYCGFSIFNDPPFQNYREYISGTLLDSLIAGKKYCVSLWVSAANNCKYQTDDIGVYFSNDTSSFTDYTMNSVLNLIPQVENTQGTILADTSNWMQISVDFTAQGGERFLTIGNFKNGANTTLTILPASVHNFGYYYIDDVSVIDCTVGINELGLVSNEISIFPNPCKDEINVEIITHAYDLFRYEITDVFGKSIFTGNISSGKEKINVSSLNEGVYFVNVSNKHSSVMKKFIKLGGNLR